MDDGYSILKGEEMDDGYSILKGEEIIIDNLDLMGSR